MIKVSSGSLGEMELAAVREVFASGFYGHSSHTIAFENAVSEFLGGRHVIAVSNGTTALHLALDALGIGPGDEVIVPSLTFIGAVQAILSTGATPIFCEVDPVTLCADVADVKRRISTKTKAVMPMHYAGRICDMTAFMQLKEKRGLRIIEDAAHAFGSTHDNVKVGGFGDVTCFSFDSIKNITCGEGGAIVCGENELAETLRSKRYLGIRTKDEDIGRHRVFDVVTRGYRSHMSGINAAIGLVQMTRLPEFAKRRQEICEKYVAAFSTHPGISLIPTDYSEIVPHIFVIRVKDGWRDALAKALWAQDIETGINYIPNHTHVFFAPSRMKLPVTENAYGEILTLPLHCEISDKEVEKVIRMVKEGLESTSRTSSPK